MPGSRHVGLCPAFFFVSLRPIKREAILRSGLDKQTSRAGPRLQRVTSHHRARQRGDKLLLSFFSVERRFPQVVGDAAASSGGRGRGRRRQENSLAGRRGRGPHGGSRGRGGAGLREEQAATLQPRQAPPATHCMLANGSPSILRLKV